MSSMKKGPMSGQVSGASQGTSAADPVPGVRGSQAGPADPQAMSQMMLRGDGEIFVSVEDIDVADLKGRELVLCMRLEAEEREVAVKALEDMQLGLAAAILGPLRKSKK